MIAHSRIESAHLAGNLLGDPSERDLFVYLPPGYEDSDRRYPTAYLLHAYGETAAQHVTPPADGERWRPPLEDVLDPVFGRIRAPLAPSILGAVASRAILWLVVLVTDGRLGEDGVP